MEKALLVSYLFGQISGIYGSYLLYKYSWPEGLLKTNQAYMGDNENFIDPRVVKQEKMSKRGFLLVGLGFFISIPLTFYYIFCH